jgi:hypothetical protein
MSRLLFTLLVLPSAAHALDRAAVEALPVLDTVTARGGTRLVLRGALPPSRGVQAVARARLVADDVAARLTMEARETKRPVDACLFETTAAYRQFADEVVGERPSELGFYLPGERLVVVNLQYGLRNLSHELVHALVGDDFPAVPSWLTEGLGSLYGGSDPEGSGVRFFVNYRMRDVKSALKVGRLPPVARLGSASSDEVYGADAMVWYGLARAALLYLDAGRELGAFYAAVRSGAEPGRELTRRIPEDEFTRFVTASKVGSPAVRR